MPRILSLTCWNGICPTMPSPQLRRLAGCLTYGDGVSDDIARLSVAFDRNHGKATTVTALAEKRADNNAWIKARSMVTEPPVLDYLSMDNDVLEVDLLEGLSGERQPAADGQEGFWQSMGSLCDKQGLEWLSKTPPWNRW
jgi:glucose-1-phosphate cytidylyltransferase